MCWVWLPTSSSSPPPCLCPPQDPAAHLKERLASVLGLVANKQRLTREGCGFMRDEFTLAFYNVAPDVVLVLSTKERGGKKK